jgi:hypothetical protein
MISSPALSSYQSKAKQKQTKEEISKIQRLISDEARREFTDLPT